MRRRLTSELHSLLLKLAKRINAKSVVWFNCSLTPNKGDKWTCYLCSKEFSFEESILEIDEHGYEHLEKSNLLPLI